MVIKISIIIVNFNTKEFLLKALESLYSRSNLINKNAEIIVVNNGSHDDSCQIIKQYFPEVVLINNLKNLGFGVANNLGVSYAKGECILLINPDTEADCDIIKETLNFFEQYPDYKSAFGGLLLNHDGSEQRGARRSFPNFLNAFLYFTKLYKIFRYKSAYDLSWLPTEPHIVECVSGGCIGMPKEMYQRLGGFDERFFLHFEDIDLCKRIWQAGYSLWFYPKVRLFHTKGGSSNSSRPTKIMVNKWFVDSLDKYLWKWNKPSAIIFSPILRFLKLLAWIKTLQLKK